MAFSIPYIESRQNAHFRLLVQLQEKPNRTDGTLFVVEGLRELTRAHDAKRKVKSVYICPDFFPPEKKVTLETTVAFFQKSGVSPLRLAKPLFEKISYREHPDGILGLVESWGTSVASIPLSKVPLLCIVEGIEKPGNLGALIRSLEGCGVDGLILCQPQVSLFNPNVVRASQGALFSLPIAIASNEEAITFLKEKHITPVLSTPHTECLYWDADFSKPIALLLGRESTGLTPFWLEQPALAVRIPMRGQGDSLNITTAGVLILYEVLRQRGLR